MINRLYVKSAMLMERLLETLYGLLRPRLTLFVASAILPLTYLLVSNAIKFETEKWTLRVYTPPMLGLASVFRVTDNGFVGLPVLETVSTPTGGFCTCLDSPQLEKADLRILISGDASVSRTVHVFAQFVSGDGRIRIDMPPVLVPTYSRKKFDLEAKDDPFAARKLPRLSAGAVTLPPPARLAGFLYWLLWGGCVAMGVLYFISIKKGSGTAWISRLLASPLALQWKNIAAMHLCFFLVLLNIGLFVCVSIFFTQRYPVADDPMMAMIANGMLGSHPSEYLIFINIMIGFLLKTLSAWIPSAPWYFVFMAAIHIGSSAIIGLSLMRWLGLRRGALIYALAFIFFIFELFFQLQFTMAAALVCLAGLSLALSATQCRESVGPAPLSAVLLMLLGSLIRYESALLIVALSAPVLLVCAFQKRRFSLLVFLLISLVGIIVLRDIDQAYYEASPGWKSYREYNAQRGGLHQTARFREFKDNSSVYSKIGWNENDFLMISQDWLYQDLQVFSKNNLAYLNKNLVPSQGLSEANIFFLRPSYLYLWMPFVVMACLLHNWLVGRLHPSLVFGIAVPLVGLLYYLAWTAHIPDRVYIPAMLEAFLLTVFLSDNQRNLRENRFWLAYLVSVGLFLVSFEFLFSVEASGRDERRTMELNKSLDKIAFLNDKILQVSITSLRYEDLPPFENDNRLRNVNFIDGLWSYPSPDTLSAYRRNGIKNPLVDLVENDNFFLLVPTFAWDRGNEVQTFLRDHYQLNSSYEVIKDPNGEACCYPNFSVLKFHLSTTPLPSSQEAGSHSN